MGDLTYSCYDKKSTKYINKSIEVIGLDTEAYSDGRCFMVATSEGDVYSIEDFPHCLFARKYIGRNFVAYNLKYDMGALLQQLCAKALETLWKDGKVEYEGYCYKVIANKMLSVRRGKNTLHFYDMLNFYCMSLDNASHIFLGERKIELETRVFTPDYVAHNYMRISEYCIRDAVLVRRLADVIIKHFETFGVYPRKLYSVAYVSYQYFRAKTAYVTVKRYWEKYRDVLAYALAAYNGGKFEVTRKGIDYYYEYDISSAYPHEISRLVDISYARVVRSPSYRKSAVYGFLHCKMHIPLAVHSPVAVKRGTVNTFPCGDIEKVITKREYDYLVEQGADITILNGWWLHMDYRNHPYKREIEKLYKKKQEYKASGQDMQYHIVKIFLNSLYGKMVQMIRDHGQYKCTSCWNPIYGALITANCRIMVSRMQQLYPSVVAVHTDSVISVTDLPECHKSGLGQWEYETCGEGVIIGSGVYQIGETSKIRGFNTEKPLLELVHTNATKCRIDHTRPYTWREVAYRGMDINFINRFDEIPRYLTVDFDRKRMWLDDWKSFRDVENRKVYSTPLLFGNLFF